MREVMIQSLKHTRATPKREARRGQTSGRRDKLVSLHPGPVLCRHPGHGQLRRQDFVQRPRYRYESGDG